MFNISYIAANVLFSLALWLQSTTNKYDVLLAAVTAFFAFLSALAGILGPIFMAKHQNKAAAVVKEDLAVAAEEVKAKLAAAEAKTEEVKTIVNGNTNRLLDDNAMLRAEVEKLRNG